MHSSNALDSTKRSLSFSCLHVLSFSFTCALIKANLLFCSLLLCKRKLRPGLCCAEFDHALQAAIYPTGRNVFARRFRRLPAAMFVYPVLAFSKDSL